MMVQGVDNRAAKEEAMGMKASEVGAWLRKSAGKRDHHELMPEDYVVLRPGPNFHWLMGQGSPARTDPLPAAPGPTPTSDDRRGTGAEDEAA
jgi:hypothetical protein